MGNEGSPLEDRVLLVMPTARGRRSSRGGAPARRPRRGLAADATALATEIGRGAAAVIVESEVLGPDAVTAISGAIGLQEPWSDLPIIVLCPAGLRARPRHRRTRRSERGARGAAHAGPRPRRRGEGRRPQPPAAVRRAGPHAPAGRAVDARDEFLAMLGHELRNPLGAILLALPLVRSSDGERPARDDRAAGTPARETGGRPARGLPRDARPDYAAARGRRPERDCRRGGGRARGGGAAPGAGSRRVALARARPIDADPVRVEQIVANLLANALKYTPSGGRVTVLVARRNEKASIRVCDDGIGIPAEMISRIFEPFTQAATTIDCAQGGLGLGLGRGAPATTTWSSWRAGAAAWAPQAQGASRRTAAAANCCFTTARCEWCG